MNPHLLDNLRDWGVVLDKLRELKSASLLDDCQPSLSVILRYRENWRLRERVLEYATEIRRPGAEFLEAIVTIMNDESTYVNTRILAANALRVLGPRALKCDPALSESGWRSDVAATMGEILGCPQAPHFREAVAMALRALDPARLVAWSSKR